jgi:hypothetical protein
MQMQTDSLPLGVMTVSTAHPIHRRNARKSRLELLKQIEKTRISRISARNTLSSLQAQFPDPALILRDIENEYGEVKKIINRGLPAVQAMVLKLDDNFQYHYALDKKE